MTDSPFGPVRKWGNEPRCFLSTSDTERLDLTAWDMEVEQAMAIVRPLSHPANLGQIDDADIEPLDRGSARALGNGLVAALLVFVAPFALYGAWRIGFWMWSL